MGSNRQSTRKVYFEVTNHCNFRCDFCPLGVSKRERRHMDFSLFQKGIDDIVGEQVADAVGFHVLGEPLLYPRIFDAVSYASDRGLRTEINKSTHAGDQRCHSTSTTRWPWIQYGSSGTAMVQQRSCYVL
jgi:MoaA/NifB/PqqE/SkfB family radical SAM enzyme